MQEGKNTYYACLGILYYGEKRPNEPVLDSEKQKKKFSCSKA
jgi:hypothetical protein